MKDFLLYMLFIIALLILDMKCNNMFNEGKTPQQLRTERFAEPIY